MNAIMALIVRILFTVLLYIFLGWTAYTIFSDLRTHLASKGQNTIPTLKLTADMDGQPVEKVLNSQEIILGRDPNGDFPLEHETVSLQHAKLSYHHKQWWVEDLNSTNGTFLNQTPVNSPIVLTSNDQLRLGQITLHIQIN